MFGELSMSKYYVKVRAYTRDDKTTMFEYSLYSGYGRTTELRTRFSEDIYHQDIVDKIIELYEFIDKFNEENK